MKKTFFSLLLTLLSIVTGSSQTKFDFDVKQLTDTTAFAFHCIDKTMNFAAAGYLSEKRIMFIIPVIDEGDTISVVDLLLVEAQHTHRSLEDGQDSTDSNIWRYEYETPYATITLVVDTEYKFATLYTPQRAYYITHLFITNLPNDDN